ncbi:hypothetical protein ACQKMD_05880 [Viridibacillus sp. NPDC096237]
MSEKTGQLLLFDYEETADVIIDAAALILSTFMYTKVYVSFLLINITLKT